MNNKCDNVSCRYNKKYTCLKNICSKCIMWVEYVEFFSEDFDPDDMAHTLSFEELVDIDAKIKAFLAYHKENL